jgi:hypothetical protein
VRASQIVVTLLGSLALASCSASVDDVGGTCSATDPCGDSSVCDFTAEGGPVCISKSGDIDNDGLANDQDFCHHQMGGAYDEDGDGIGDDCDRCPIAAPRPDPDSDNDMVDAPCDPEPSMDGNEILLFDGFQGGAINARWEATTPSAWRSPGGEMIADLSTVGTQEYMATTIVGKNTMAMEVSFRVDKVEASATRHLVGIYAHDPRPAGVAQAACYVTKADPMPTNELVVVETNAGSMNMPSSNLFDSANLYRAGLRVAGTAAGCSVLTNGNPLGIVQAAITPDQLTEIALTAHAASVRYQYIIIVGR